MFCSFDLIYRDASQATTLVLKDTMCLSSSSNVDGDEWVMKDCISRGVLERLLQLERCLQNLISVIDRCIIAKTIDLK